MAIRQYIGARYVTKVYENSLDPSSAEWEASTNYEPLTMVTYNNGSYLSKKEVPGSVGDPASNPDYWVQTGFYNGQIAYLQSEIDTINGDITTINNRHTPYNKIMVVTDSYGTHTHSVLNKNFAEIAADLTGLTIDCIAESGAGLINGDIINEINNYTGDGTIYDTVIYLGGANDQGGAVGHYALFNADFVQLKNAITTKFPNVKNILCMCSGLTYQTNSYHDSRNLFYLNSAYRNCCRQNGIGYVANAEYILRNTTLLESDYCHPNDNGIMQLAYHLSQFLITGVCDVKYQLVSTLTLQDTTTLTYIMTRHNNEVNVSREGASTNAYADNLSNTPIDGQQHTLGTFDNTLINCDKTDGGAFVSTSANMVIALDGTTPVPCECNFFLSNKELSAYLRNLGTSTLVGGFHVTGTTITFTEF